MIEGLITGQMRKPSAPVLLDIAMDGLEFESLLQMSEQIDGHRFLIRKKWFGRVLAPTLILQRRMLIVDGANPQKELYELIFWFHNPTLQRLLGLHPYP